MKASTQALLVCLSAVFVALGYPLSLGNGAINGSVGFAILCWVAFVPLLFVVQNQQKRSTRFLSGFFFGIIFHWIVLYWIIHSMHVFGGISIVVSAVILNFLVLYLSLFTGFWALLWPAYGLGKSRCFAMAAVWTLLEFVKTYFLTGFPWCHLGYSQHSSLILSQFADVFGVYGLSFLVMFVNGLVFEIGKGLLKRTAPKKEIVFLGLVLVFWTSYGVYKLNVESIPSDQSLKIGVIQGNIPQDQKWQNGTRDWIVDKYITLSKSFSEKLDVIVWPESSFPYSLSKSVQQVSSLRLADRDQTYADALVFGAPSYQPRSSEVRNSAFIIDDLGNVQSRYDKIHLVLYGEFVPLSSVLPIQKLTQTIGNFTRGESIVPFSLAQSTPAVRLGPSICYEIIYPELSRRYALIGAKILVNMTNDAWFGTTSGPFQHFTIARFRAIETRRPLVRAANTGISAIVDSYGRVIDEIPLNVEGTLQANVPLSNRTSWYVFWGDLPLMIFFLLLLPWLQTTSRQN